MKNIDLVSSKIMKNYKETRKDIEKLLISFEEKDIGIYENYFISIAKFLIDMMKHREEILDPNYFLEQTFEELKIKNKKLYEDILPENYNESYVNPTYSSSIFGKEMGGFLAAVNYEFRIYVGLVYENRIEDMIYLNLLCIKLYKAIVVEKNLSISELKLLVRNHLLEDIEGRERRMWARTVSPEIDTYSHIPATYDLKDLRYLFRYGMYIGDNEIISAKHILALPEKKKHLIIDTYVDAFVRGFVVDNIPLEHKRSVLVTYHLGMESLIKLAYERFNELKLRPIVFYNLRGIARPRLYNTRPNEQMIYDHRFSDIIYYDKIYMEKKLEASKAAFEYYKEEEYVYAGPALIEIFGKVEFNPKNSEYNLVYDQATSDLKARFNRERRESYNKYVPGDSYSYTINAYPVPSIGDKYEEIFDATIGVNTLDNDKYEKIQEKIIDELDKSEYVIIKGEGDNKTDLRVNLYPLTNPDKQTKFDNCTADVNVPVGEVFTSPVLKGTEGILHVKDVYLIGLRYLNLKIWLKDGMIVDYDCTNYKTKEENKNYIRENLLHPHSTLPLGEFAIGTNTIAYMMARKFGIQSKLPILIGEKTGPHFAVGDTCFTWSEDLASYNSNGKEMIARENEKTCQRKTNTEEAYTYRHTDITIPYDELDSIIGYNEIGNDFPIIEKGRFVVKGTEELNIPLDQNQ